MPQLESVITCPACATASRETMPQDLAEEVEDSDEAFDRMRERVTRPPLREVDDA